LVHEGRDLVEADQGGGAVSFGSQRASGDALDADTLEVAFSGELWQWRGPAPHYFITVPDDASAALRAVSAAVTYGWGMIPVRVRIGDSDWATSLFPKDGRYIVPVKQRVRLAERLAEGDTVPVQLEVRL
jgi:hypothetical protein